MLIFSSNLRSVSEVYWNIVLYVTSLHITSFGNKCFLSLSLSLSVSQKNYKISVSLKCCVRQSQDSKKTTGQHCSGSLGAKIKCFSEGTDGATQWFPALNFKYTKKSSDCSVLYNSVKANIISAINVKCYIRFSYFQKHVYTISYV